MSAVVITGAAGDAASCVNGVILPVNAAPISFRAKKKSGAGA